MSTEYTGGEVTVNYFPSLDSYNTNKNSLSEMDINFVPANEIIPTDYVVSLSASGKTVTYTKKDGTTGTFTTQDTGITTSTNITTTKSTQTEVAPQIAKSGNTITISGLSKVQTGMAAGTYTLKNLLQELINRSHTHLAQSLSFSGSLTSTTNSCSSNNDCH